MEAKVETKKIIETEVLKELGVDTRDSLTFKGRLEYDLLTFKDRLDDSYHTVIDIYDISGHKLTYGLDGISIEEEDLIWECWDFKFVIPFKNIVYYNLKTGMPKQPPLINQLEKDVEAPLTD
ncbi:MAG: hypothetical protein ABFC34_08545 [Methanobacterium sp.]